MKGIIWKYHAKADDPDLKDEMGRAGCRVLNPDPDFWANGFPVWAICGPWARGRLEKGDLLIFAPTIQASRAAGIDDFICTGYLVVRETVPSDSAVLADPRFSARYKANYSVDLRAHLKDDPPRTKMRRGRNIIVGDPAKSRWFGREGRGLAGMLRRLGISMDLRPRLIRTLSGEEAVALLEALSSQA